MWTGGRNREVAKGPRLRADEGFTLIELLIVLGILVLLAALVAPQVIHYLGRARTEAAKVQINSIVSALDLYALDVGGYPSQEAGLAALVQAPPNSPRWSGPYL